MNLDFRVAEIVRFALNGLFAAGIHFAVLSFNLRVLEMPSAGLANFFAAWFGIAASFIGSRFFVFRHSEGALVSQAMRFLASYAVIACLHGLLLYIWTDQLQRDYTVGLFLAVMMQAVLSYLGNKLLVFKAA
ncbi:putative flippase GtrA [Pseudomonas fluvialis]|uniref:Putative flippase GtrA n=1 Tax=Pseudomonas fluvialis TaxID=1793966 RepID=A0A7X0EUP9_9PSED|nr:GtrA family protein [Pseudomonas fluvialis]MBB6342379.1 putative flippase GtrA [Pseudomonas fluvialis]